MLEFFEKNLAFLIFVSIVGSFVIYSVKKDEKKEKKDREDSALKKSEEIKKKEQWTDAGAFIQELDYICFTGRIRLVCRLFNNNFVETSKERTGGKAAG